MAINSPYRTSSDLVLQVLTDLGILATGQGVDPEDFARVNSNLDSVFRKLSGLEICFVADPNNIPGAWFKDLASIVAGESAMDMGLVGEAWVTAVNAGLGGAGNVEIGAGAAAKSLKIISRGRPTFEPLRFVNY